MAIAQWNVELFGNLRAQCDDRVVDHFKTYKTGALFGYLAAQGDHRQHRREELIEMFWPESGGESGRNNLRMALCFLRSDFETPGQEDVVIANRSVVYLNPEAIRTDKAEFETLVQRGLRTESEEESVASLEQAIAQYRGELLPEFEEDWLHGERRRLTDAYLMGLKRLIKFHSQAHHYEIALDYAHRALETDPFREESHRTLIRLLGIMGRPAAALQQFRELERVLKNELNATPSASTRELITQLTEGAKAAEPPATIVSTRPAMASPSPPASEVPKTSAFPAPLTRLFGREDDIAQIIAMLNVPETRLITVTGLGGMGKTRLALAVAERLRPQYLGASWFVPLTEVTDPKRIPDTIARTLGLPPSARITSLQQIITALSKQDSLLLLDNMEHLAAEGSALIQTLLESAPSLRCLITSRQRLGVSGEYEYLLRPLPVPLLKGTPERLREFASVQLFLDRATASYPDFVFDADEAEQVAALCRRLDGLPLAIELAAAWEQVLTTRQILSRLTSRFGLLVKREKGGPTRHASLRATLDWSFNLLAPEAQRMLARLSVFRGGWTLEAAEAICGNNERGRMKDESNPVPSSALSTQHSALNIHPSSFILHPSAVLELLTQLRERSLLNVLKERDAMRFSMLETVREYAEEQLESTERAETQQRHTHYFAQMARDAEPQLRGSDAPTCLNTLETEHDNLRSALDHADAETGLTMATALYLFWYVHNHQEEGCARLRHALDGVKNAPLELRARALMGAGNLAYALGDLQTARKDYTEALALRRKLNDPRGIAASLCSLGNVSNDERDFQQARVISEEGVSTFRSLKDPRNLALSLSNLGNALKNLGDNQQARVCFQESLTLFRAVGDEISLSLCLNNMASLLVREPDFMEARPLLVEATELTLRHHNNKILSHTLANWAYLSHRESRMERAAHLFGTADVIREELHIEQSPSVQDYTNQVRMQVQQALGETEYHELYERGRVLTKEQAIALALESPMLQH